MKISKMTCRLFGIYMMLILALFRIYLIPNELFKVISLLFLLFLLVLCGRNVNRILRCRYILLFSAVVMVSTYQMSHNLVSFINGLTYALRYTVVYLVVLYVTDIYGIDNSLRSFRQAIFFLVSLADISALLNITFDATLYQNLETYLIGNKFVVSYFHMLALTLWGMQEYERIQKRRSACRTYYLLYCIFSLVICGRIACSTGIIGCFLIGCLIWIPTGKRVWRILLKPVPMLLFLIILNFLFFAGGLLENSVIQYIIVNVLKEGGITMTGRLRIYSQLGEIIRDRLWIGYGANNAVITRTVGYGNAQNGIMQYMVEYGVAGTFFFLINWYQCVRRCDRNNSRLRPAAALIYALIVCSLVEVSFGYQIHIVLAFMMAGQLPAKKRQSSIEDKKYENWNYVHAESA